MKNYVVYDYQGVILQTGSCPAGMLDLQASPGRNVLEGTASMASEYVVDGAIKARPSLQAQISSQLVAADGVSTIIIDSLPAGVALAIHGPLAMNGTTDGSAVELTFAVPGVYTIWLSLFPYQNMEWTINAT